MTSAPTASTTPEPSWPATIGGAAMKPGTRGSTSVWHMPAATMRTSTSCGAQVAQLDRLDGVRTVTGPEHGSLDLHDEPPGERPYRAVWRHRTISQGQVSRSRQAGGAIRSESSTPDGASDLAPMRAQPKRRASRRPRCAAPLVPVDLVVDGLVGCACLTVDPAGLVTSWSDSARRMFGHDADAVIGRHLRTLQVPGDEGAERRRTTARRRPRPRPRPRRGHASARRRQRAAGQRDGHGAARRGRHPPRLRRRHPGRVGPARGRRAVAHRPRPLGGAAGALARRGTWCSTVRA